MIHPTGGVVATDGRGRGPASRVRHLQAGAVSRVEPDGSPTWPRSWCGRCFVHPPVCVWNLEAEKPGSLWVYLVPVDAACWLSLQSGSGDELESLRRRIGGLSMPTDGSARAPYVFIPAISRVNNY